jgi:hypothetical protein
LIVRNMTRYVLEILNFIIISGTCQFDVLHRINHVPMLALLV